MIAAIGPTAMIKLRVWIAEPARAARFNYAGSGQLSGE
jgi:hypothetical protein